MSQHKIHYVGNDLVQTTPAGFLASILDDWHRSLDLRVSAGELAQNTAVLYKRGMSKFLEFLPTSTTEDRVREWKAELLTAYKSRTVNAWLAGVKSFFAWAKASGRILDNPAEGVPQAKQMRRHERDILTDAEVRRVLTLPDPETPAGARDSAILALMAYAALRTVEVHRADLEDIQTRASKTVMMVHGKGHRESDDLVVLNDWAESIIGVWLAERGDKPGPLFISFSNRNLGGRLSLPAIRAMVKRYFRLAGIFSDRKTTHSLRHTAITKMIVEGLSPTKVMSVSRHKRLDTLMVYAHDVDRLEQPAEDVINYD